ncbi:MAG: heavy metal translocating P-type ATPase, partial [Anaerotignaceae bacterium]
MRCKILHESKGRIRVHVMQNRMTMEQADKLEYYLKGITEITDAKVFDRTADIIITYLNHREVVLEALSSFSYESFSLTVPEHTGREINRVYEDRLILSVLWHYFKKLFIPLHIRIPMDIIRSAKYIYKGICSVLKGQANV